jgi:hypothetical protein
MRLPIAATLIATAALAAAGCGSDAGSSDAAIDAGEARVAVERATGVKLADTELIKDGKKHGLLGSFANLDKVITDRQMVMLLVLDESGKAAEISEQIQGALPPQTKELEHENTLVRYATQGKDRSAAIDKALAGV